MDDETMEQDKELARILKRKEEQDKSMANHYRTIKQACYEYGRAKAKSAEKRSMIQERAVSGSLFTNIRAQLPCQKK